MQISFADLECAESSLEEQEQRRIELMREACHVVKTHYGYIPQLPNYLVRHSLWFKILCILAFCAKYVNTLRERMSRLPRLEGEPHELLQTHQFRTQLLDNLCNYLISNQESSRPVSRGTPGSRQKGLHEGVGQAGSSQHGAWPARQS